METGVVVKGFGPAGFQRLVSMDQINMLPIAGGPVQYNERGNLDSITTECSFSSLPQKKFTGGAMGDNICDLSSRHCVSCEGGSQPLGGEEAERFLATLSGWELQDGAIAKRFEFKNFYRTMAFVNAVAWVAHMEDHHPDLEISYRACLVRYTTHAINGLSENDFICASKVDDLIPT
jgi:4a-hydroxytetrahydrobiopterin dehydratase